MNTSFEKSKNSTDEWYTPKEIIDALGEFDLDPCAPMRPLWRTARVMYNKDPELESINSFNDTVKKANEIKDRVLKYVYNIKQERSYNNDLVGIFERYKDIADGDLEVAMKFIKEAYPFNEETESFIRKKFDMPIPEESKEQ